MTEQVYLETRFQILSGVYAPGNVLDREAVAHEFGCSSYVILDAFSTLLAEGYIETPKRAVFAVRSWDKDQLQDHYDMWATLLGVAAGRASERASMDELLNLAGALSKPGSFDFSISEATERHIVEFAVFNAELIRLSKVVPLMGISHKFIPNCLFRMGLFCSTPKQLMDDRKNLELVAKYLRDRDSACARDEIRKLILRSLPFVTKDVVGPSRGPAVASIKRFDGDIRRKGCEYGLGGREPSLDGLVCAYGVSLS